MKKVKAWCVVRENGTLKESAWNNSYAVFPTKKVAKMRAEGRCIPCTIIYEQ